MNNNSQFSTLNSPFSTKAILLVEDNELIQQNNKAVLERNGYTVRLAMNLAEARKELANWRPDAIVLDITLPDGSGLDLLRELRGGNSQFSTLHSQFPALHSQFQNIPVLLLTAMGGTKNTAAGLDAGSDDYLAKPYSPVEFRARVDALMRRAARVPETLVKGRLILDITAGAAALDGVDLRLTKKDFALLLIFVQNEGCFMSAEYLYEKIWKAPMAGSNTALKDAVKRLRAKIAGSACRIAWSRGEGWRFESG
jgi:DNA-binding response OmpR family regulator